MERITVGELSILITANCNLKCAHCLRGDNADLNIDEKTIENIFSKVDEIGELLITGGEPLYSDETIKRIGLIIDAIKENKVIVHQIQLVTNGTIYNKHVLETLTKLYALADNKENSAIIVSEDKYHQAELKRLDLLRVRNKNCKRFKIFADKLGIKFDYLENEEIISMGRAEKLKEATKKDIMISKHAASNCNGKDLCVQDLYVSLDGSVIFYNSLSYDLIRQYTILNINDTKDFNNQLFSYSDSFLNDMNVLDRTYAEYFRPTRSEINDRYCK